MYGFICIYMDLYASIWIYTEQCLIDLASYSTVDSGRSHKVSTIWGYGIGQLSKNYQNNSWCTLKSSLYSVA